MNSEISILITGASGFVGANLCNYFVARGYKVVALTGTSSQSWRLDKSIYSSETKPFDFHQVDLTDSKNVHEFIKYLQPQIIFNCAAYGAYSSQTDSDRIYKVNFDGVRFLLESVRKLNKFTAFIQAGTSSEYGQNCSGPKEEEPTIPDSDYAVSKVAASQLIKFYGMKYKLPAWIFRLYSIYGPFEEVSRLIPNLLLHIKDGKLPSLVDKRISRDFIYIDDVCEAFEKILDFSKVLTPGETYNIGSGRCVTLEELLNTAKSLFNINSTPEWGSFPNRHWDHANWFANPKKAAQHFKWEAKADLIYGLKSTMKWLEENPNLVIKAKETSILSRT
jgi:nucleoside-diphosphate-sugar epimerase